jgi:hypothetical protein
MLVVQVRPLHFCLPTPSFRRKAIRSRKSAELVQGWTIDIIDSALGIFKLYLGYFGRAAMTRSRCAMLKTLAEPLQSFKIYCVNVQPMITELLSLRTLQWTIFLEWHKRYLSEVFEFC